MMITIGQSVPTTRNGKHKRTCVHTNARLLQPNNTKGNTQHRGLYICRLDRLQVFAKKAKGPTGLGCTSKSSTPQQQSTSSSCAKPAPGGTCTGPSPLPMPPPGRWVVSADVRAPLNAAGRRSGGMPCPARRRFSAARPLPCVVVWYGRLPAAAPCATAGKPPDWTVAAASKPRPVSCQEGENQGCSRAWR